MAAEAEFPATVARYRRTGADPGQSWRHRFCARVRRWAPSSSLRPEVHPFSAKQIALLETFANQAVIAIENVRLFNELEARNRDLTNPRATDRDSEILQVISRSPTDAQPVFETIIRERGEAVRRRRRRNVYRFDGRLIHTWPSTA